MYFYLTFSHWRYFLNYRKLQRKCSHKTNHFFALLQLTTYFQLHQFSKYQRHFVPVTFCQIYICLVLNISNYFIFFPHWNWCNVHVTYTFKLLISITRHVTSCHVIISRIFHFSKMATEAAFVYWTIQWSCSHGKSIQIFINCVQNVILVRNDIIGTL